MPSAPAAPVFIVGQSRSGSSILYRLIQEHPEFALPGGSNLSESQIMPALATAKDLGTLSVRSFASLDDAGWAAFIDGLGFAERRRRLATRLPGGLLQQRPSLWAAAGCQTVLQQYIAASRTARGARRLVEKTPTHLVWMPHLRRAFPDATFLCIARHPVHVFASFRRRAKVEGDGSWATRAPDDFAAKWQREAALTHRWLLEAPDRFRLVRYERLVADPDAEQRELFAWLGTAPLAELPGREEAHEYAPVADKDTLYGEIRPTTTDWRSLVTPDEVAFLETTLAAEMAGLGYEPIGE